MLVAIPSETPGGLDALISDHFGHCAAFTLVQIADGQVGEVTVMANGDHEQGGCLAPVQMLKEHDVSALIAGRMGKHPLVGFLQAGIDVYHSAGATTVREAAKLMASGACELYREAETCGGSCSHSHHHAVVDRPPLEGRADVRNDRVVSIHYTLTDKQGQTIDSTEGDEPMRYLHGHDNLPSGLEQALTGLEAGARVHVELAAADAYGERDESMVIEVPRDQLPEDAYVGARVHTRDPDGRVIMLTVVHLDETSARLDGNHTLAGQALVFDVTVLAVEAAVPEELEHGHPH